MLQEIEGKGRIPGEYKVLKKKKKHKKYAQWFFKNYYLSVILKELGLIKTGRCLVSFLRL